MTNLTQCKRCGGDITLTPRSTNKKFCGVECYESWWSEERSQGLTNADRNEILFGPVKVETLSPAQAAWLAALIDGEGTISIGRRKKVLNRSGFYYQVNVTIANTNFDLISYTRTLVGPDNSAVYFHKRGPKHKDCYTLRINVRAVPTLLRQLHSYLIIKKRQAEMAIKVCELKEDSFWVTDNHEIYEHFYLEAKALNRRGR